MSISSSVLSLNERIQFLERQNLFCDFTPREIETFLNYMMVESAKSQQVIIHEAQQQKGLAFLVKGEVKIVKKDDNGEQRTIAEFKQGKLFGEMSLLDGQANSASVVTKTDVVLMILSDKQFKLLIKENPQIAVKLLLILSKTLSARLRLTSGRLVDYLD